MTTRVHVIAEAPRGAAAGPVVARRMAAIATCAVVDAAPAAILLVGTPLPRLLTVVAAAVAHGGALLLMARLTRARPSWQWLSVAALGVLPCVGALVAAATELAVGQAPAAAKRRKRSRRRLPTPAAVDRLGSALSPCDALRGGDEDERHAALSALSRRSDPEAVALLRWAAAGSDAELALSSALALDEIGENAERRAERLDRKEVRRAAV